MADILIRGMKMPKSCAACPFNDHEEGFKACSLLMEYSAGNSRLDNCPLHELPPHGDLIDRDKIKFTCAGITPEDLDYARRYVIDRMPVIVPADKGESE